MNLWPCILVPLSLIAAVLTVVKLLWFGNKFIFGERIGLSFLAAALVLSIPNIIDPEIVSPFSNWYQALLRTGVILLVASRVFRDFRHAIRNKRAERMAYAGMSEERRAEFERRKRTWR